MCDGIFVNYTWEENYPKASAETSGDRKDDVCMGIDVFGRGTFGGGQWTANVAIDLLKKNDASAAIPLVDAVSFTFDLTSKAFNWLSPLTLTIQRRQLVKHFPLYSHFKDLWASIGTY